MRSAGFLSELDALRNQVADLSSQLAERNRSAQDLREQSDRLHAIVKGTAAETGDEFFPALVTRLTSVLHITYAFIGEVQGDHSKKIRTLAVSAGGVLVDNFDYELADTPCATALTQTFACFDRNVQTTFPQFQRLVDLGAESYCAVPIRTKDGAVIGLLVVMDTKPLEHTDALHSLLEVFAPRIAAEFERKRAEQERAQALADLHNVIETIPDTVFALNTQGNLVKWNRRLEDATGYSREELLNKPALAFVPPEEQTRTAAAIEQVFIEGHAELEGHLLTKDRRYIPYHWTGALLKDAYGEPIGITGIGRDVSGKKWAEEALRESEERFSLAADGSTDALWDAHPLPGEPWYAPQTPIWWSSRVRELLGLQESESFETLEEWVVRLHPDDKDGVFSKLVAHIEHRVPYDAEYRLRANDGDYRWIRGRGQAIWDEQGELRRMSGSCQDITERKRMEEERQKQEVLITLMLNTGPACIKRVAADGSLLHMNPTGLKLVEACGEPEVVGRSVFDLVIPEHREAFISMHRSVIEGQSRTLQFEIQGLKGTRRWMESHAVPFQNPVTGQTEQLAVTHNITDRKQAEEALRKSEEHFRAIFENTAIGIAFGSHTMGSGISEANPAFQSMTGYNLEELCHLGMKGLTYPDDFPSSKAFVEQLVSGALTHGTIEKRYVKKDGSIMWAQTTVSSILDEQGDYEHSVAMIQDITTRKINEQLLAAQKRVLEMIATDAPLREILTLMCQAVEELSSGVHCSILLLDRDGLHLRHGAAPSLPEVYAHAIDGVAIGPAVGSCGTAAFTRRQVIVSNIAEDPLWTDYRDLALCHGLKACWSTPVISSDGAVLGTFAMYYGEPQQPTHADLRLVERAAQIACIAIERKQTEEALRKSEERYVRATAVGKVGVWELDVATGTYHGDPNLKALFGYADDELSTDPFAWLNLVHPDDQSIAMDHWQRIVNGEMDDSNYELRMLKKDGTVIWTNVRGHAVRDPEGQVTQLFGATVDISERKQVQDALVQSERQLRTVLDSLPVGVWFTDRLGRPLLANPMAERILSNIKQIGLQNLDNAVSGWETVEPATDPYRWALSHVLRTGEPSLNETLELECLDGTKKTIRNSAVPVLGEAGNIMGAVVLNEDITLLRVAQEVLELTKFSVDCAVEGFFWIGPDARILNVNEAACCMLEYTREELTAMTVYDIDPNVFPEVWLIRWEELKEKGFLIFESKYWSRTGRVLNTEVTVNYLRYEGSEYGCAIMRDIEPRKRADVALRASEERYRALYEDTPTMYFTLATDGRVLSVNRFGAEQLGYRVEELIGHSVLGLFHDEDKEAVAASLSECLATPAITRNWEFRKVGKDGNIIWVRETARVDQSSAEEPIVLVTCEDITEHKRAEDESRERIRQASAMQAGLLELAHLDDTRLTFPEILTHVTRIVADILAVERVSLWLLSDNQGELVCQNLYLRGQATHSAGSRLAASSYPRYFDVIKESLVIAASDARVDQRTSEFTGDYFSSLGITSVLDVPIRRQGKLVGVLWCEHIGAPREWAHETQDFAASVGQTIVRIMEAAERKRAEVSLRQSEERYRSLVNNAPIGIFVNEAGRFIYTNREFQRILNATRAEQLLGMPVLDRIAPEFHQVVKDRVHEIMERGQPVPSLDEQYVRLDGSRVDVAVTAIPASFDGTLVMQVLVLDITERKRAEAAVRLAKFSVDGASDAVYWIDPQAKVLDVNEAASRMLGYSRDELCAMNVHDLNPDFQADKWPEFWAETQRCGTMAFETVHWAKNGQLIPVEVSVNYLFHEGKEYHCAFVRDITARKQAEKDQRRLIEDLTRSQQHFQSLFNWTPSAVGINTVAEGRFVDVNEGFILLTGYRREEILGCTTLELGLWADPAERETVLREIREKGRLHNREGRLRTKSGETRSLMVSVESIQLGSTPCLIYLIHDITERKRMEDALRTRERELRAALQEREQISQDLHDGILQSLFAVGLNLEVAKSLMPPRIRKTSGAALNKSIDQLNRVMREIRNFIAGLGPDPIEGKDLQAAVQSMLISLTENQPTRVRLAIEKRAVRAVSAEQSFHLFRVIQEAVSNCIRHGGAQEARVSLKMLKQGVRLSIRDNGRGFNQDTVKAGGYGLHNMAARAQKISGRFTVLSKENEGTRIILDLPKEVPHFPR
ncbi:MAG: PAS domain S-box protein [Nitrospira sp. CG24A]|nr:MAG: PAS domain S-box protein [Nitrospira sp. CG24A]